MNTDNIIAEYLGYLERMCGFAPRTLAKHKRMYTIWKNFLNKTGNKSLMDAGPADLLEFIEFRQKSCRVKNTSISGELCVLRTLYGYLSDFQKISSNPAAALPELICEPPAEKAYLSVEECFKLLESFDLTDLTQLRNYTIVALLWSTGLRSCELCALDWRDINLKEGTLLVRRGKGGKQRQLFLNHRLLQDLLRYRQKIEDNENGPVFYAFSQNASSTKKHARLSQSRLVEIIREYSKAAGIKKDINPLISDMPMQPIFLRPIFPFAMCKRFWDIRH